jgi:valyl-tRNA synthetase
MAPLARPALHAYRTGRLRFIPERRGEEYTQWLENIRDWCISRQLWWGHRIPVWYCEDLTCGRTSVSRRDLTACPGCGGVVRQDEDVLDTWFSSWLVPFSSLGWPEETADLAAFYPGDTLVTAPEILFFWVARMVMAGLEFRGDLPFSVVYLHGTVRDTLHRKMSKSLGNGIDPLDVVGRYGADALRYTILAGMGVGTDLILDPNDLEGSFAPGRNFANKLWNAGRFILSNLEGPTRPLAGPYPDVVRRDELGLADRWIIARCDATVVAATEAYRKFRLNEAALAIYHFLWSDLADWYLEQIKPRLYGDQPGREVARAVVARVFEVALQLLHPIMPFITEELWQRMPGRIVRGWIGKSRWPEPDARAADPEALAGFARVQELVDKARSVRSDFGIEPGKIIPIEIPVTERAVLEEKATVERLVKGTVSTAAPGATRVVGAGGMTVSIVMTGGGEVAVDLGDAIDLPKECARLTAEIDRLARLIQSQEGKLANEQFVSRAPPAVVDRERKKLGDWQEQSRVLADRRRVLGCA